MLVTVGRTDIPWVREGLEMYVSRLEHYVPFTLKEIPELKGVSALSQDQIRQREGEGILKLLKPSDELVLLDERAGSTAPWSSPAGWKGVSHTPAATWSSPSAGPTAFRRRCMPARMRSCPFRR